MTLKRGLDGQGKRMGSEAQRIPGILPTATLLLGKLGSVQAT